MPKTVTFLGWIFVLLGAVAVLELATGLLGNRLVIGVNLLLLPAGYGLLTGREKWRSNAVALVLVNAAALLVMIGLAYAFGYVGGPVGVGPGFGASGSEGIIRVALSAAGILLVFGWVVWYLTRPQVKAAFRRGRA